MQGKNIITVFIILGCVAWLLVLLCYNHLRDKRNEYIRDRFVDYSKNKIYCKECRRQENIVRASASLVQCIDSGEYYNVCVETDNHKEKFFTYVIHVSKRSGCLEQQEQTGGPGFDL